MVDEARKQEDSKVQTQRGPGDPDRGAYELADMSPRAAGLTIAGLAGLVAVVAAGVGGLFLLLGDVRQPPAPEPRLAAPAPQLQTSERADRVEIEARARACAWRTCINLKSGLQHQQRTRYDRSSELRKKAATTDTGGEREKQCRASSITK